MRGKGLGNCARQLIKEVATVRSMDIVLPIKETQSQQTREVRLRVVARPDRAVAELLVRLGLDLPSVPKIVPNELGALACEGILLQTDPPLRSAPHSTLRSPSASTTSLSPTT